MKFTAGLGKLGRQACAKASRGLSAPRRQEHPPGQPQDCVLEPCSFPDSKLGFLVVSFSAEGIKVQNEFMEQ